MADDQVKYSDLISDDVAKGIAMLDEALKGLRDTMASLKDTAVNIGESIKGMGTVTKEQQQVTAKEAAEIEALNKKVKDLTDKIKKLEDVKLHYRKLTDDQITSLKAFQAALQGSSKQVLDAVNAIEIEKKSYNELNAIYNTLKDSLNAMTIAERQNSEAGKAMTAQAAKIYDTMNELQKATGKYTLQVGKYRAAFDGLGYSFQQILREAPSALNLNQFFLAISNNIPMFLDQLKSYRAEQAEIKANLDQMTKGTKEYAEQQEKVVSVGKKLARTIFSWQSLVLVGLLALRNLEKIKGWLDKIFNSMGKIMSREKMLQQRISDLSISAMKAYKDEEIELGLILDNLRGVVQGTNEWKLGIERVNEITKSNLSTTHATISEVESVTDAYLEQMRVLAMNKQLVDTLSGNDVNMETISKAYAGKLSGSAAAKQLGLTGDNAEDFEEAVDVYVKAMNFRNAMEKRFKKFALNPNYNLDDIKKFDPNTYKALKATLDDAQEAMDNAWTSVEELISEYKLILDSRDIETLKSMYKNGGKKPKVPKTPKTPKGQKATGGFDSSYNGVTMEDVMVAEANAMKDKGKTALETIQLWYNKKVEIAEASYWKEMAVLDKEEESRQKSLDENLNKAIQFKSKYTAIVAEVDKDPYLDEEGKAARKKELEDQLKEANKLIGDAENERQRIRQYYNGKRVAAEKKLNNDLSDIENEKTQKTISQEEKEFKEIQEIQKRQFELTKHTSREEKKFVMQQQMDLLQWRIDHAEALGISPAMLEQLKKEYAAMQAMFNKGIYSTGNRNSYSSGMQVISDVLGFDITNEEENALNSVFDQAKAALNSWMDARKAAADQAKELADDEVSAAENALNREIELRNQGYANDVALREKELADAKEQQKKALEMQQKAKEEELAINTALEASNMAVAIANLIKQFGWWSIPMIGVMLGAWTAAKVSAFSQIKSTKYREGGVMLLEGGSHESGHDVNLGIGPDGSNLRAEGGEYFAVINKRNSRKYGSQIPAVVNALNSGMFEDRYIKTSDAVGLLPQVIRADNGTAVDLSSLEGGVDALVKQGESRWSTEGEWRVMRYKNLTRRVRIS